MRNFLYTVVVLLTCNNILNAQSVRNVDFTCKGNEIHVTYDLFYSAKSDKEYILEFYYSLDGGSIWEGPVNKNISGDLGYGVVPSNGLRIVWKPLEDLPWLYTDDLICKVELSQDIDKYLQEIINLEMMFVEGGTFLMGCTENCAIKDEQDNLTCWSDEVPVHMVTLDDYYIGKYEITQYQWKKIMGDNPSFFNNCDECPVESVYMSDIEKFIKKLNKVTGEKYRLPTEAEWEYAARGGNKSHGYKYSGSDNVEKVAEFNNATSHVGLKKPNELGIYDMSGNVREWCSDWYFNEYYKNSPVLNPRGKPNGKKRVIRGGSWLGIENACRVCNRDYNFYLKKDYRYFPLYHKTTGFRLVLEKEK